MGFLQILAYFFVGKIQSWSNGIGFALISDNSMLAYWAMNGQQPNEIIYKSISQWITQYNPMNAHYKSIIGKYEVSLNPVLRKVSCSNFA